jgi:hypothetical protein
LRTYCDLQKGTVIRHWQSLKADTLWKVDTAGADRKLPLVDLRCAPPQPDEDQWGIRGECAIEVQTDSDADQDHSVASLIYDSVQEVCERMRQASLLGTHSEERLALFIAKLAEEMPSLGFGGLTYGGAIPPYDDAGVNTIGLTLVVHFSMSHY